MPTSLASCVTLTLAVGGNAALALLLTLTTNLLGIFTLPYVLSGLLHTAGGVELPPGPMLRTLVEQILVPLGIGVGIRAALPALRVWIDANRKSVSMISTLFLATVPWMQVWII
jgi:solute carrier family 10 (sodium/bile acid cotransporter), member 7